MKQGKTLMELAAEITERSARKKDFVADTLQLAMCNMESETNGGNRLKINGIGDFKISSHTHGQISSHLNIPKKYYDMMLDHAPALLSENVNHWFNQKHTKRMIRTDGGNARAFLSNRYRVLDHEQVLEGVLPVMAEMQTDLVSCEVTERRLYLKCLFPRIVDEITVGDVVQSGCVISNSEIGLGAVNVSPLIYRLSCKNGAISQDYGMKKYHVGRIAAGKNGVDAHEWFKDDTLIADDKAFLLKLRDVVMGAMDQAKFNLIVDKLRHTEARRIEGDVVEAVEVVQKWFDLNDDERSGVLTHLIQGGDLSQYGMINAVTRASQDVQDYDRATDLERIGGKIINLNEGEWKTIATAKAA